MKVCNYNQIDVQAKFEYSFSLLSLTCSSMRLDRMSTLTVMVVSRQFLKIHNAATAIFLLSCAP